MSYAHTLLSAISNEPIDNIKATFEMWWHVKGKKMLQMDVKSARHGVGEQPEDIESEFLEDPPHPSPTEL